MDTIHAIINDITTNRATVVALGDERSLRSEYIESSDVRLVLLPDTVEVGERVWLDSCEDA